ncbi:MAG: YfiR family protein [Chitinophagales bacterium]
MLTFKKISLLLLSLLLVCSIQFAQANNDSQKADYIYNFIQYVEWSGIQSDSEVVIGVIGSTDVYSFLEQKTNSTDISQSVSVRSFNNIDDLLASNATPCHILFISQNQDVSSPNLEELARKSILLVGEKEGFAQHGGLINFIETKTGSLKFEINQSKMISYGFKVSPQLLRIAILAVPTTAASVANGSKP